MKKFIKALVSTLLVAVLAVAFVSCVPAKAEKAKKKLEKADYEVAIIDESLALRSREVGMGLEEKDLVAVLMAGKDSEMVTVYFCKTSKAAKKILDKIEDEDIPDGYKVGRSGKVVYAGTEQAVKDLKK